ncbi:hypothetical protein GCM10022226_12480 [Sphaerisporangium flaviroseum]|uniref:Uncharacterized protein n=1 Tax=Sphaerisporangium flaviroseum TaxID=509199 RepID=A0ABP7HH45_9ACTN
MSWLSDRLSLSRLRTGPTALSQSASSPAALLEIIQLADPSARLDGADIVLTGLRVEAGVELGEPELRKLNIHDEDRLWAYRIVADGPLPMDGFDRLLAEGIAHRLDGWALTRGSMSDPADAEGRGPIAYLGEMPPPEEMIPLLRGLLRPADSVSANWESAGPAELDEGIVHLVQPGFHMYGGADIFVTAVHDKDIPPVVLALLPYATQVVKVDVVPFEEDDGTVALEGDQALLDTGAVALAVAEAYNGVATDLWRFQISKPEDLLAATPDPE